MKLGWIPYWNLRPLGVELLRAQKKVSLTKGHPTKVNRLLREGQLIAAPCSSINLLLSQDVDLALPLGVASTGRVDSVYLGIRKDTLGIKDFCKQRTLELKNAVQGLCQSAATDWRSVADSIWSQSEASLHTSWDNQCPRIKLTSNSASGATLSRIFYRLMFGEKCYKKFCEQPKSFTQEDSPESPAHLELLIGDIALIQRSQFEYIIDLGSWWKRFTGLPFVFAVWQRGAKPLPTATKKLIYEAASLAQAKMHVDPTEYLPEEIPHDDQGNNIDLNSYWSKIRYRLTPEDFNGLILFLALSRRILGAELQDTFIVKMDRWREIQNNLSPLVASTHPEFLSTH